MGQSPIRFFTPPSAGDTVASAMKSSPPDSLYDGYIFDLDGTIYLGGELLPGAKWVVETLRSLGKRVVFLSNNPTRDVGMYLEKLGAMGLEISPHEMITTVFTTTQWLLQNAPGAVVFPIAEEPLVRSLKDAGIALSEDPEKIDIVVASYDRTLTWKKLQIAFEAIWYHRRARLIATNPDAYCPFPGGRGEVDAGAVIAAIEAVTGATLEVNCGKPSPVMLKTIMNAIELPVDRCLTIGDRLYTEIRMGIDCGMDTAVVFTGETTPQMLLETAAADRPTWTVDRLDQLIPDHHRQREFEKASGMT